MLFWLPSRWYLDIIQFDNQIYNTQILFPDLEFWEYEYLYQYCFHQLFVRMSFWYILCRISIEVNIQLISDLWRSFHHFLPQIEHKDLRIHGWISLTYFFCKILWRLTYNLSFLKWMNSLHFIQNLIFSYLHLRDPQSQIYFRSYTSNFSHTFILSTYASPPLLYLKYQMTMRLCYTRQVWHHYWANLS